MSDSEGFRLAPLPKLAVSGWLLAPCLGAMTKQGSGFLDSPLWSTQTASSSKVFHGTVHQTMLQLEMLVPEPGACLHAVWLFLVAEKIREHPYQKMDCFLLSESLSVRK